jgi:hypothetical protein
MKNIFLLFTILFVFLFCLSCKKTSPSKVLPPITQTGANTFGCKINGQVWVPYYHCDSYCMGCLELAYNIHQVYETSVFPLRFSLEAGKSTNTFPGFLDFSPAPLRGPTDISYIYHLGNVADSMAVDFLSDKGNYTTHYRNPKDIFEISKLDTLHKIISGIFSFTLYNSPSDSIVITEGRFDLQLGLYSHCSN